MPIDRQKEEKSTQWMRFASTGSQMLGAIAAAVWLGVWLDSKTTTTVPWLSIALPVLTVIGILFRLMKETKPNKK